MSLMKSSTDIVLSNGQILGIQISVTSCYSLSILVSVIFFVDIFLRHGWKAFTKRVTRHVMLSQLFVLAFSFFTNFIIPVKASDNWCLLNAIGVQVTFTGVFAEFFVLSVVLCVHYLHPRATATQRKRMRWIEVGACILAFMYVVVHFLIVKIWHGYGPAPPTQLYCWLKDAGARNGVYIANFCLYFLTFIVLLLHLYLYIKNKKYLPEFPNKPKVSGGRKSLQVNDGSVQEKIEKGLTDAEESDPLIGDDSSTEFDKVKFLLFPFVFVFVFVEPFVSRAIQVKETIVWLEIAQFVIFASLGLIFFTFYFIFRGDTCLKLTIAVITVVFCWPCWLHELRKTNRLPKKIPKINNPSSRNDDEIEEIDSN